MQRLRLTRNVMIWGTTFFGKPAHVMLEPTDESTKKHGWQLSFEGKTVPITFEHLHLVGGELALRVEGMTLKYVTHLLALRYLIGLDAVTVHIKGELPMCGSAQLFLDKVSDSLEECGEMEPVLLPAVLVGEKNISIRITPDTRPLFVSSYVEQRGVGDKRWNFFLQNFFSADEGKKAVHDIATARMPGQSRLFTLARGYSTLPPSKWQWPHFHEFVWQQEKTVGQFLEEVARHRILDLLGALSVITAPGTIFCGRVLASNTTSETDLSLVKRVTQIRSKLEELASEKKLQEENQIAGHTIQTEPP